MDIGLFREWTSTFIALASLGWAITVYVRGARKAELASLRSRIEEVADDLKEHKEAGTESREDLRLRLSQVEQTLQHMPTNDAVHELALAVTEIKGLIATQGEALKAVAATAQRVESFLLERNDRSAA